MGGIPNSGLVFVGENPTRIKMMTGGTPISGNPHIYSYWDYKPFITGGAPPCREVPPFFA